MPQLFTLCVKKILTSQLSSHVILFWAEFKVFFISEWTFKKAVIKGSGAAATSTTRESRTAIEEHERGTAAS